MPLSVGERLGHYEVLSMLGQGGMGEVYRARDTTLKRDVALKVLPATLLGDPERMIRFQREAEVLASLDHPNIGPIYGIIDSQESRGLVLALIEGPTLADQIALGPLPLDDALSLAKQIIEALEYAHDRGVVHRDLKPANIKITPDGVVKVLDFGLAKVLEDEPPKSSLGNSPTMTLGHTRAGVILGTAAYMSPEQAVGRPVDRRSDIFSFGAVLCEMLTGRRTFAGATTPDVLEAVVKSDADWSTLPAGTPPHIRTLLRRCLTKDRKQRLQAIGEARILLEGAEELVPAIPAAPLPPRAGTRVAVAAAAGLAVVALIASWMAWRATRPVEAPLMRLNVDLGPDAAADTFVTTAISPDGARIVYLMRATDGKQQLATRLLSQTQATVLPETDDGSGPFFSPDGQWIGFFASGKLKKISVEGGAPVTLCDAPNPRGGSWGDDGNIVAALNNITGLYRVSADGGTPQALTQLKNGEVTHRLPQVLPGSQAILFTASTSLDTYEEASIELLALKTGERTVALRGGYWGRYRATQGSRGHLLYIHGGVIYGAAFDPSRPGLRGAAVPLIPDVASDASTGGGQFDISAPPGPGTLVYLGGKGTLRGWPMVWLDSSGKTQPLLTAPRFYYTPRFSPDGRRLVLGETNGPGLDLMVYDLQRDTKTRLTFSGLDNTYPAWMPDGKHIAFRTRTGIGWIRSDGGGEQQSLLESKETVDPGSFSPDGRNLAYDELSQDTGYDLWTLSLDLSDPEHPKPGKPEVFLRTRFAERNPAISPDGRWVAYQSNESGSFEVYVRPFSGRGPGTGGKWQVSPSGGSYPMWSRSGRELFYETNNQQIMSAEYTAQGDSFSPGKPRLWSKARILPMTESNLDLAPDGKRIVAPPGREGREDQQASVHVNFLLNFFDELRRRVPSGK